MSEPTEADLREAEAFCFCANRDEPGDIHSFGCLSERRRVAAILARVREKGRQEGLEEGARYLDKRAADYGDETVTSATMKRIYEAESWQVRALKEKRNG